jgi:hypothetical protein
MPLDETQKTFVKDVIDELGDLDEAIEKQCNQWQTTLTYIRSRLKTTMLP